MGVCRTTPRTQARAPPKLISRQAAPRWGASSSVPSEDHTGQLPRCLQPGSGPFYCPPGRFTRPSTCPPIHTCQVLGCVPKTNDATPALRPRATPEPSPTPPVCPLSHASGGAPTSPPSPLPVKHRPAWGCPRPPLPGGQATPGTSAPDPPCRTCSWSTKQPRSLPACEHTAPSSQSPSQGLETWGRPRWVRAGCSPQGQLASGSLRRARGPIPGPAQRTSLRPSTPSLPAPKPQTLSPCPATASKPSCPLPSLIPISARQSHGLRQLGDLRLQSDLSDLFFRSSSPARAAREAKRRKLRSL